MYQKEKEQEETKQDQLLEKVKGEKNDEIKKSADIIKQAKQSLSEMDEEQPEIGMTKEEKDAIDKVDQARREGEKIGADAA